MKYWITIIFNGFALYGYGQDAKIEVSLFLKMLLFQESTTTGIEMNKELFDQFNSLQVSWDTLRAENFDDYVFLTVLPALKNPKDISMDKFPLTPDNCNEYIVCFSRDVGQMYRLKGFKSNDFSSFIMQLKKKGYPHLKSKSSFVKYYSVEKLDLGCLCEAFRIFDVNINRFKCLQTCSDYILTQ